MRRWRGTLDVPLTENGVNQALELSLRMERLDAIYCDKLSRCVQTAAAQAPNVMFDAEEAGPWRMGHLFEGREITEDSLDLARYYISKPYALPPGGEPFCEWSNRWMNWLRNLKTGFAAVGIVTHNRNIQYLYASQHGHFVYKMYDVHGPDFCSVHVYSEGLCAPWGGKNVPRGLYLIRHGETNFGT